MSLNKKKIKPNQTKQYQIKPNETLKPNNCEQIICLK